MRVEKQIHFNKSLFRLFVINFALVRSIKNKCNDVFIIENEESFFLLMNLSKYKIFLRKTKEYF